MRSLTCLALLCASYLAFQAANTTAIAQKNRSGMPTTNTNFVKHSFQSIDGTTIDYWLMSPDLIEPDSTENGQHYPLVLTLHGRGCSSAAADKLGTDPLRKRFPAYVIAPASTKLGHWSRPEGMENRNNKRRNTKAMLPAVLETVQAFANKNPVDKDQIYVTGQSMGGLGTFAAIASEPTLFAAAIPVAGGWTPDDAKKIKDIPIWVFHGYTDKTVPPEYSRTMVDAIRKAGGSPKFTEYKGVGHNSWSRTYDSMDTWRWLFSQHKTKRQASIRSNPE